MSTNPPAAVLSRDDHSARYVITKRRGFKTLAIISGIALLLLAAVEWPQAHSDVAPVSATPTSNLGQSWSEFSPCWGFC
jgi:hypothetical protein